MLPAVPVVAGVVASHDVPIYSRGIGTVIAYNTVVVRSQIQGQITQIAFTEGRAVQAGDLLAQIDPHPYQAQLDQTIATRDRDQAQLTNALGNLDRYNQLQSKGYATPQLTDTQKAQVAQLQSAIKSDEALIEQARVQLGYASLSPITGVTGVRQVDAATSSTERSERPGRVTQIEPISVIFSLSRLTCPKSAADGKGPLAVRLQPDDHKLDEGRLDLVDNEILQTTGTIRLKAEFQHGASAVAGRLINVRLLLRRHDGLTVPESAVQRGQQGAYACGIDPTMWWRPARSRSRRSPTARSSWIPVSANEQVVVDGQYKLRPGSLVTILHGKAAEEAASQSAQQANIP
jgi:multidrug efflux system membrane fusion protein